MNIKAPAESGLGRATIGLATVLLVMLWTLSAQAATAFTGDKIQGLPVIAQLDVNDLEPGKTQRFMFQGVEMGSGEFWYVPVIVTKGAKPGKTTEAAPPAAAPAATRPIVLEYIPWTLSNPYYSHFLYKSDDYSK